jgi:uncharacterized protein (DUF2141 family)
MVGYRYLIFALILLLSACAQIGTISGGPQDTHAPKPIAKKIDPPNGSTRFMVKQVEIPFDEFFRLNNPNINIRIVPSHTTIQSRVKGKSLFLSWEDDLEPNTTYAIYLNNAVKDITESNDSIIQYVFSTGDKLDTLSYSLYVTDAWSAKPVSSCLVGLFDQETDELRSFTETDKSGFAKLNYLKEGNYRLVAFMDENGDLEQQDHEAIAFQATDQLEITTSVADSFPLRLFTPRLEPAIRTSVFIPPGYFLIGATRPIEDEMLSINGDKIDSAHYVRLAEDSLQVFFDVGELSSVEFVLNSKNVQDTASFRFSASDRESSITLRPFIGSGFTSPWDSVSYFCNDFIKAIDTSLIEIVNSEDSSFIRNYSIDNSYNSFTLSFENRKELKSLKVLFKKGAITTTNGSSKLLNTSLTFQSEKKYGSLNVQLGFYKDPIILMLNRNGKAVQTLPLQAGTESINLEGLTPGDYSFSVVRDANNNGRWDVGDYETLTQPELVDHYSSSTTVRANWEVDVSLIPINEE